jgi:hypothetical protein
MRALVGKYLGRLSWLATSDRYVRGVDKHGKAC